MKSSVRKKTINIGLFYIKKVDSSQLFRHSTIKLSLESIMTQPVLYAIYCSMVSDCGIVWPYLLVVLFSIALHFFLLFIKCFYV